MADAKIRTIFSADGSRATSAFDKLIKAQEEVKKKYQELSQQSKDASKKGTVDAKKLEDAFKKLTSQVARIQRASEKSSKALGKLTSVTRFALGKALTAVGVVGGIAFTKLVEGIQNALGKIKEFRDSAIDTFRVATNETKGWELALQSAGIKASQVFERNKAFRGTGFLRGDIQGSQRALSDVAKNSAQLNRLTRLSLDAASASGGDPSSIAQQIASVLKGGDIGSDFNNLGLSQGLRETLNKSIEARRELPGLEEALKNAIDGASSIKQIEKLQSEVFQARARAGIDVEGRLLRALEASVGGASGSNGNENPQMVLAAEIEQLKITLGAFFTEGVNESLRKSVEFIGKLNDNLEKADIGATLKRVVEKFKAGELEKFFMPLKRVFADAGKELLHVAELAIKLLGKSLLEIGRYLIAQLLEAIQKGLSVVGGFAEKQLAKIPGSDYIPGLSGIRTRARFLRDTPGLSSVTKKDSLLSPELNLRRAISSSDLGELGLLGVEAPGLFERGAAAISEGVSGIVGASVVTQSQSSRKDAELKRQIQEIQDSSALAILHGADKNKVLAEMRRRTIAIEQGNAAAEGAIQ